jgi:sugar lactone lactonase YvrE
MRKPPLEPSVWQPPPAPPRAHQRRGPVPVELHVFDLPVHGPEDVAVDGAGNAITGLADGRILRVAPDGQHVDVLADTEGRPLGIEVDPDGNVLVCDARRGVLGVEASSGNVRTVLDGVDGAPFVFCNNGAVARDGTVYFTDSSTRFGVDNYRGELLAHTGTGRLLRRAVDGTVDVLLDGLHFANGVALAPDEASVVVAEMGRYRLMRLWLSGARAGESDVLVDNLPGFPDNISTGTDGLVWVALPSWRPADDEHPRRRVVTGRAARSHRAPRRGSRGNLWPPRCRRRAPGRNPPARRARCSTRPLKSQLIVCNPVCGVRGYAHRAAFWPVVVEKAPRSDERSRALRERSAHSHRARATERNVPAAQHLDRSLDRSLDRGRRRCGRRRARGRRRPLRPVEARGCSSPPPDALCLPVVPPLSAPQRAYGQAAMRPVGGCARRASLRSLQCGRSNVGAPT